MKRRWIASLFVFMLVFGLMACQSSHEAKAPGKSSDKKQHQAADQPKNSKKQQPKEKKPKFIYPLTGKPADHKIKSRPIAVMVENSLPARPQSGLYKADVVYEALAEGAITRFMAVYQSQHPKIIGPVRSARPYFVKLSQGLGAIYVCHGWSPQARALIKSQGVDNLNGLFYDGTLFHRKSFRDAPHNSYIPYQNIIKGAKENHFKLKADTKPLPFLSKKEVKHLSGAKAAKVRINYLDRYHVKFVYQPDKGTYLRYSDGDKSLDYDTKTPITVSNVFIAAVPTRYIDSYPRRGMDLKAGGKALLLQNGKVQKLRWKNINGRILPVKNGKPVGYVPGQTWVNLVPADPGIAKAVTLTGEDQNAD
ncbi:MAG TPA: DUF3048 domain-containing protein [Bacillales bacterium]|nr:DUF3048 domain-containing protein [Bacillales bacterium]